MVQMIKMRECVVKHILDGVLGDEQQIPIQIDVALFRTDASTTHLILHICPLESQTPVLS